MTIVHWVPAGGGTAATGLDAATVELFAPELHAASANIATAATIIRFIIFILPWASV
jgi:hypothetical protein